MSKYRWKGYEIEFGHREEIHQKVTRLFIAHSENAKQRFRNNYKSRVKGKDQNTITEMAGLAFDVLEYEINSIREAIKNEKLYIRLDDILDEYEDDIYDDIHSIHRELVGAIFEIKNIQDEMRDLREERKLYRKQWVGGGFGIKGAVKGAVEAGILNAATDMGISAINAVGNFRTSMKISHNMNQILDGGREAMQQSIIKGIAIIYHACLEVKGVGQFYTEAMITENELVLKQCEDDRSESAAEYLFNNIRNNPYNKEQYKIIIKRYGDSEGTLESIGKACGIDIKKIKEDILSSECDKIKISYGDKKLREYYLFIQRRKKELGFTGQIDKEIKIQDYLKDDLANDLKRLVEQIRSGDEASVDRAFEEIKTIRSEFAMVNSILEDILKQIAR